MAREKSVDRRDGIAEQKFFVSGIDCKNTGPGCANDRANKRKKGRKGKKKEKGERKTRSRPIDPAGLITMQIDCRYFFAGGKLIFR